MLEDLASACSAELAERGLRDLAALGERAAQDLSHRSRVLLALSEGLSATRTMSDVAQAVELIAVEHLGCLHAGIWLRGDDEGPAASTRRRPSPSSHRRRPPGSRRCATPCCPYDDTNPLGGAAVHGRGRVLPRQGDPERGLPAPRHLEAGRRGALVPAADLPWPGPRDARAHLGGPAPADRAGPRHDRGARVVLRPGRAARRAAAGAAGRPGHPAECAAPGPPGVRRASSSRPATVPRHRGTRSAGTGTTSS